MKVSLNAKLWNFGHSYMGQYSYIEQKLTVGYVQVENRLTFAAVVAL